MPERGRRENNSAERPEGRDTRLPRKHIDNAYIQGVALHRLTYEIRSSSVKKRSDAYGRLPPIQADRFRPDECSNQGSVRNRDAASRQSSLGKSPFDGRPTDANIS